MKPIASNTPYVAIGIPSPGILNSSGNMLFAIYYLLSAIFYLAFNALNDQ